jgi:uncharacterized protein YdaU (DUF1376 family)
VNYYLHHIGDYLKDTSHLSGVEDGMYRRMLDLYYSSEKPLPLNIDGLYRLVRAKSRQEKEAVDTVLEEFFQRTPEGWRQSRADREVAKAQEKSGKAKASASIRWHCDGNANAMRTHSEKPTPSHTEGNAPNPNPNPNPNKTQSGRKRPLPVEFGVSESVKAWAEERGFGSLQAHLDHFIGWAKASGKTYVDWDQAFMNAIRDDWAKVRGVAKTPDYSAVMRQIEEEEKALAKH